MRMRRKHRGHSGHERTDRWLVSYADYMTLIFALFVVLYALAIYHEDRYDELRESFKQASERIIGSNEPIFSSIFPELSNSILTEEASGVIPDGGSLAIAEEDDLSELPESKLQGAPFSAIEQSLSSLARQSEAGTMQLEQDEQWLTIELDSRSIFPSGSAALTLKARTILREISQTLKTVDNYVRIRGYTDDRLVRNELFASNWELSAARAVSVLRFLNRDGIAPQRMAIEAFGQYRPVLSNETEEGRAKNRRVVIAVSKYAWVAPVKAVPKTVDTATETPKPSEQQDSDEVKEIPLPGGGFIITTRKDASS
ncbi:OmpA family protein [Dongshaea marina]|uniref:OmpA family protein n=1 Tax=Dongshaea marina TaxID=2047966 RepID=UPI000D3E5D35|nr:OmpA family protein [Dongshaea marina]